MLIAGRPFITRMPMDDDAPRHSLLNELSQSFDFNIVAAAILFAVVNGSNSVFGTCIALIRKLSAAMLIVNHNLSSSNGFKYYYVRARMTFPFRFCAQSYRPPSSCQKHYFYSILSCYTSTSVNTSAFPLINELVVITV
jgi:hypothetical protein